jgi:dephospho-CoA kinase
MGKSTTAKMFAAEGCAIWDADAAVHRLYGKGGAAVAPMAAAFPEAVQNGAVERAALREIITNDPSALSTIEKIVHPLLGQDRADFIAAADTDILVFDIPLLFETGGNAAMDGVACVFVDADTQMARILDRGTMTQAQAEQIIAKQMPAAEKCALADFVIPTDTLDIAQEKVAEIVAQIRG